ncbi:serine/arginine repetitive matrix protein 5-like [Palaemon carinicauda]|uniref:serine/arginine repetitive matrix protein 5-like n=1 Tax=Palaemon carinicauda TaxID=392227 RepID=UPI0035B6953F
MQNISNSLYGNDDYPSSLPLPIHGYKSFQKILSKGDRNYVQTSVRADGVTRKTCVVSVGSGLPPSGSGLAANSPAVAEVDPLSIVDVVVEEASDGAGQSSAGAVEDVGADFSPPPFVHPSKGEVSPTISSAVQLPSKGSALTETPLRRTDGPDDLPRGRLRRKTHRPLRRKGLTYKGVKRRLFGSFSSEGDPPRPLAHRRSPACQRSPARQCSPAHQCSPARRSSPDVLPTSRQRSPEDILHPVVSEEHLARQRSPARPSAVLAHRSSPARQRSPVRQRSFEDHRPLAPQHSPVVSEHPAVPVGHSARHQSPELSRDPHLVSTQHRSRSPARVSKSHVQPRAYALPVPVREHAAPTAPSQDFTRRPLARQRSPARQRLQTILVSPARQRSPTRQRSPDHRRSQDRQRDLQPARTRSPTRRRPEILEGHGSPSASSPSRDLSPARPARYSSPTRYHATTRHRSPARQHSPAHHRSPARNRSPSRYRSPHLRRQRSSECSHSPMRQRLPSPSRQRIRSPT